jgi:hypothetical protein
MNIILQCAELQGRSVTHRWHNFSFLIGLAFSLALLLLTGCGGQTAPTASPEKLVPVARIDGAGTLVRPRTGSQGPLPDQAQLAVGDHLYTEPDATLTLQFADGSTLQMGPNSHVQFFAWREPDQIPILRLLGGALTAEVRGNTVEVQAFEEVAKSFSMVVTDLAAVPRGGAGSYTLGFVGDVLKATVTAGEFDLRSGNQQATLPAGWQAIAEPGKSLQIVSLVTPTPAPPSATEAPTATLIPIILITPTETPTLTPTSTGTATPTSTRTRAPIRRTATPTITPSINTDTPTATAQPNQPPPPNPPPTKPPPTNPPPTQSPPTNPPPTEPPPTEPPRPTPAARS